MERFENFESNSTSHRYWAPGFTHPSEVETLPILPTCGHGCGPAERVLPGGKATQGWIQEHLWEEEAAASKRSAAKSLQSCPTLCDPVDGNPPGSRPWDSPGNSTGVGCHFLLQCMKVKVKSLSRFRLFATPWTVAHQAPPSTGFPRQEYWSGVPLPSPHITLLSPICLIRRTMLIAKNTYI